jgi:hypothetical protein
VARSIKRIMKDRGQWNRKKMKENNNNNNNNNNKVEERQIG